jgi:predicted glycosyltransferase
MKPRALLYCQHSLGLGHFVRSLTLAQALASEFDLVFINGGPIPQAIACPAGIRFEHLPPLRMEEDGSLSGDGEVGAIFATRLQRMLKLADTHDPRLLIVELYPFGRKKFAQELDPLIARVRGRGGKIVCSVRDILVNQRPDQVRHDDRAARCLNAAFDAVLVHADENLTALAESFKPSIALAVPIHHTGFVTRGESAAHADRDGHTLVTAGGGIVGQPVYHAALAAQPILWREKQWPMTLVAGPMFPEPDWTALREMARDVPGLTLLHSVPQMAPLLRSAGRVLSQCGYNSALEIVLNELPALFVPFARNQESEQTMRAQRLRELGLADWMHASELSGRSLAERLLQLRAPRTAQRLAFNGAARSAAILKELAA